MRLRNKNETPIGGWHYTFKDSAGNSYTSRGETARILQAKVASDMRANNITVPENLWDYIEDQICSRQPPGQCVYESKLGDGISHFIHTFAGGIDKAARMVGIESGLEKKARECMSCGQRRVRLNH